MGRGRGRGHSGHHRGYHHHHNHHHNAGPSRFQIERTIALQEQTFAPDTIFLLIPKGASPDCGLVCCPTPGVQYLLERDQLPTELQGHLDLYEYIQFIDDCNQVFLETTLPTCPCALTIFFYCVAAYYYESQRNEKLLLLMNKFNEKLSHRQLVWLQMPGFLVLKTKDPTKFKLKDNDPIQAMQNMMNSMAAIAAATGTVAPINFANIGGVSPATVAPAPINFQSMSGNNSLGPVNLKNNFSLFGQSQIGGPQQPINFQHLSSQETQYPHVPNNGMNMPFGQLPQQYSLQQQPNFSSGDQLNLALSGPSMIPLNMGTQSISQEQYMLYMQQAQQNQQIQHMQQIQ